MGFQVTEANVIDNAARIATVLDNLLVRIEDGSSHYHKRLQAALAAALFVYRVRTALIKREDKLSTEFELQLRGRSMDRIDPYRSIGYGSKIRRFRGDVEASAKIDVPLLQKLRDSVSEFRQLAGQLCRQCETVVNSVSDLVNLSFADVRKQWKPLVYTREMVSFLRGYVRDVEFDGTMSKENVVCGLVCRHDRENEHGYRLLRWAKAAWKTGKVQLTGQAPAIVNGLRSLPDYSGKRVNVTLPTDKQKLLAILSRPALSSLYRMPSLIGLETSYEQTLPRLLSVSRVRGSACGARWLSFMTHKGLTKPSNDMPQVITGCPIEIPMDGVNPALLPLGYTVRALPVTWNGKSGLNPESKRIEYPTIDGFAIICLGPLGAQIEWAHEINLSPETVIGLLNRFSSHIDDVIRENERKRLWNLSQAEREKAIRKDRLSLACEIRKLSRITFQDSRSAGNCAPGTETFCRTLGIPTDVVDGFTLARKWRKANYVSDHLLRNVVRTVKLRQTAIEPQSAVS